MLPAAVAAGLVAGLGVLVVVRELLPSQPHLGSVLTRLSGQVPDVHPLGHVPAGGLEGRLGRALERRLGDRTFTRVPVAELALLRTSAQTWFGHKALYALVGLVFPPLVAAVIALTQIRE